LAWCNAFIQTDFLNFILPDVCQCLTVEAETVNGGAGRSRLEK